MITHGIRRVIKVLLIVLMAATAFSFAVMWLWNWLMPAIFGLHAISFWQALGLLVLSKILFGGFHGRPGFGRDWRTRFSWDMTPEERDRFRTGLRHWKDMTPEERDKFRADIRRGCGPFESSPATPKE
jgi:hypothetical protein